jgi:3-methyladenine DNA glycosylase/8-oxoguanine DNA glycosylase
MVAHLVTKIGGGAFPGPEQIIKEELMSGAKGLGVGYRGDYLVNLSRAFLTNPKLEILESKKDIHDFFAEIKGFGPYAVNHMLVMLGHYDRIPIDGEVRRFFAQMLRRDVVDDEDIQIRYSKKWQNWNFLAYKMDRIRRKLNYIDDVVKTTQLIEDEHPIGSNLPL